MFAESFGGVAMAMAGGAGSSFAATVDFETIRKANLTHEASIQGIGALYLLGAVLLGFAGVSGLIGASANGVSGESATMGFSIAMSAVILVLAALQLIVGLWLRRLKKKAVIPATILSTIGLLGFPIGTLVNAYVLYLLHCAKGKTVFSPEYQEVIRATPHIKYKTPIWVWILLIVLIALLVGGIAIAAAGA